MKHTARIEEVGLGFDVIVETDHDGTHTRQVLHIPDLPTAGLIGLRLTDAVIARNQRRY